MYRFFKKLNIPAPVPKPIVGNFVGLVKDGISNFDEQLFDKYKSDIVGYFEGSTPNIISKDVDMIRHVMVKDFAHFVNRRVNTLEFSLKWVINFNIRSIKTKKI